ncbi:hypothetical protein B0H16DRAFT_1008648 [Mycena metata]|uniref:Uncharacterized protein n=1 Tax=Mycena metata TaxID=1033252 RepID=A0AAD7IIF3_9AGAR|nr:hypothetical protein B0H16DRAFT_1008648 [Mycena metata]
MGIASELQKMYKDSKKTESSMDALQLRVMHERILLCYQSNNNRARLLNILGDILLQSYKGSGTVDVLNQAVCAYNDAVQDDPGHAIYLADLGRSLLHRFERLGSLLDINRSVLMFEEAVQLTPDGHPDKPSRLNNLGNSLLGRFKQLGDLSDINKSILMKEEAVQLTPDGHPDKPSLLNNLGSSLLGRFERLGSLSDINKSVSMFEEAVQLTPYGHPDKPFRLNNLSNSLLGRFERLGNLSDINKSVLMKEDAVQLTPDGHPEKPSLLNNLGNSLFRRFERLGDLSDINKSVSMFEDAVQLTPDGHPDKPSLLNNLGNSLFRRFERLGDLSDINKSVLMFEEAVQLTPDGHPNKPSLLNNLGNSLLGRFKQLDLSDINKSILMKEEAVQLTPDDHPDKPSLLNNLGNSLLGRFKQLGDLSDINKSILMKEQAVQLTPDGHPDKPSLLNNLGNSLLGRFERLGDLSDINKSVLMFEEAVQLTPDGHPEKPSLLNNLGNSLFRRFERLGDLSDINKSVLMFEDAVQLTPHGHPDKPSRLNNLGNSLLGRFEQLGNLSDINKSVLMKEDAVQLTPDGHPEKPSLLNNLGNSLFRHFEQLGDLNSLNKFVIMQEDAVHLTPDGHPDKPSLLANLRKSLLCRFECLGDPEDLKKSTSIQGDIVHLTPDGQTLKSLADNPLDSDKGISTFVMCSPQLVTSDTVPIRQLTPEGLLPEDIETLATEFPNGHKVVSQHAPDDAILWVETYYRHSLLQTMRTQGVAGPIAAKLTPDESALVLFGSILDDWVLEGAKLLSQMSHFPVMIRPHGDDPVTRWDSAMAHDSVPAELFHSESGQTESLFSESLQTESMSLGNPTGRILIHQGNNGSDEDLLGGTQSMTGREYNMEHVSIPTDSHPSDIFHSRVITLRGGLMMRSHGEDPVKQWIAGLEDPVQPESPKEEHPDRRSAEMHLQSDGLDHALLEDTRMEDVESRSSGSTDPQHLAGRAFTEAHSSNSSAEDLSEDAQSATSSGNSVAIVRPESDSESVPREVTYHHQVSRLRGGASKAEISANKYKTLNKWNSPEHSLDIHLEVKSGAECKVAILSKIQFTVQPKYTDEENKSQPQVIAHTTFIVNPSTRDVWPDRSYSRMVFLTNTYISRCIPLPCEGYIKPNQTAKTVKTTTKGIIATVTGTGSFHPTGALAVAGSYSKAQATENQNDRITPKWVVDYENGDMGNSQGQYYWEKNVSYTATDNEQDELEVEFSAGINVKESNTKVLKTSFVIQNQTMLWIRDKSLKAQGYGMIVLTSSCIPDITTPTELCIVDYSTVELAGIRIANSTVTETESKDPIPQSVSIGVAAATDNTGWFKRMFNRLARKSLTNSRPNQTEFQIPRLHDFKARGWDITTERWKMPAYPLWGQTLRVPHKHENKGKQRDPDPTIFEKPEVQEDITVETIADKSQPLDVQDETQPASSDLTQPGPMDLTEA